MSAGDEDTELRDLVTQTLENNGLLGKIQAQLRAGVFLALEDTDKKNRKVHHNKRLQQFLATKDGLLAAGIVQEFLEFFQLDYTSVVFEPECGVSGTYGGRTALEKQIDCDVSDEIPLLSALLKQGQNGRSGHNVHLNDKSEPTSTAEFDPANDTLDFLSNRRPVDEMVKKYSNSDQGTPPPQPCQEPGRLPTPSSNKNVSSSDRTLTSPISDQISEQISEHLDTEQTDSQLDLSKSKSDLHTTQEWEDECKNLDDKLHNIGIKTPDIAEKTYDDDFEKTEEKTDEVSAISDIDDLLHTSERATEKIGEESMFTSDHTISVDSVGDVDYVEDITF